MFTKLSVVILLGLLAVPSSSLRLYRKPSCNYSIGNRWNIQRCCLALNYQDGLEVRQDVHCFNYSDTEKTQYQIEFEKTYKEKGQRFSRYI